MALIALLSGLSRSHGTKALRLHKSFVRKYSHFPIASRPSFQHVLQCPPDSSTVLRHNHQILLYPNFLLKPVHYFSITSTSPTTEGKQKENKLKVKVVDGRLVTMQASDSKVKGDKDEKKKEEEEEKEEPTVKVDDHTKLWCLERYVSASLMIVVPLALCNPCPAFDVITAVALALHTHWGFEAICTDYVPDSMQKMAHVKMLVLSILTLTGLLLCVQNDIGLAQTFLCLWQVGKEDAKGKTGDEEKCECGQPVEPESKGWFG